MDDIVYEVEMIIRFNDSYSIRCDHFYDNDHDFEITHTTFCDMAKKIAEHPFVKGVDIYRIMINKTTCVSNMQITYFKKGKKTDESKQVLGY